MTCCKACWGTPRWASAARHAWARHLDELAHTLEPVEHLHQRLRLGGSPDREAFFRQPKVLFDRLDTQLQGAAHLGTGLRSNMALKKVLGISTKSYLHKGEIAGYAQRMREIAQTSNWLSTGRSWPIAVTPAPSSPKASF